MDFWQDIGRQLSQAWPASVAAIFGVGFLTGVAVPRRHARKTVLFRGRSNRDGTEGGPPDRFSPADLEAFVELVRQCGEAPVTIERVRRAKCLAMAWAGGELAAVAALKRPADSYRTKVAQKAGVRLAKSEYPYEVGYICVCPTFRRQGHAARLVTVLQAWSEDQGLFATVRTNNVGMASILSGAGFERIGSDYLSERGSYCLGVWVLRRR